MGSASHRAEYFYTGVTSTVIISASRKGLHHFVSGGSTPLQSTSIVSRNKIIASVIADLVLIGLISALVWFFFIREEPPTGQTDSITIAMPATDGPPQSTQGGMITHLTITGGEPGDIDLHVRLTDMAGQDLPSDADMTVTAGIKSLNHPGTQTSDITLNPVDDESTPTFQLNQVDLPREGWWRIRTVIEQPDHPELTSDFYVLLPDPNIRGVDAPESPESDEAAVATLNTAISDMSEWTSLRWWEWLSGGNDSMIISRFSITTPDANGEPDSFMSETLFAGGFEPGPDGTAPAPPQTNHMTSVTIGDQAWSIDGEGAITERSPTRYLPIDQYPETYAGAEHVRYGITEEVNGELSQIITFHVPTRPNQAEAWYAFWIGTETDQIHRMTMVAENHYMIREYSDVNEPFVIDLPEGPEGVDMPLTTPVTSVVRDRPA